MANKTNLGIGAVIGLFVAAYFGLDSNQHKTHSSAQQTNITQTNSANTQTIETQQNNQNQHGLELIRKAYESKLSNIQVQSFGHVKAVLRDDNEGSRHQKFILSLDDGLTVLVAHNIDLSPKVENLKKGDMVEFFGEYEYSHQGGVIHWTHHDPQKRHPDGWLKHNDKTYQ